MWEKIITNDLMYFLEKNNSKEITAEMFLELKKANYDHVVTVIKAWKTMDNAEQAEVAIGYVGENLASCLMMAFDYLFAKARMGRLLL